MLILGLLRRGSLYGYELNRIVRAHGELYADLKKANLYYLLEKLAKEGDLTVESEPGTRGARGERLIYTLTEQGRAHFADLLRTVIRSYETLHTGVEVAIVFLNLLTSEEAIALLEERRRAVFDHRQTIASELKKSEQNSVLAAIASDHMLSLIDAELGWLDRSIERLKINQWGSDSGSH